MKKTAVTGKTMMLALGLLTFLTGVANVHADSMRCGRKVIRTGDTPSALLARCGEPLHRSRAYAKVKTAEGMKEVRVERWHYKKSERSLERIVMIYRGEVVAVETGRR